MDKEKQAKILKYLLGRIYRSKQHKDQLDARIRSITKWHQPGVGHPDIEARILEQKNEIDQAIVQVMDILDCLPTNSVERQICELRHIDSKPWGVISAEIPMSRSQVNRRYQTATDMLLLDKRIQQIVAEHEAEYNAYIRKDRAKGKRGVDGNR